MYTYKAFVKRVEREVVSEQCARLDNADFSVNRPRKIVQKSFMTVILVYYRIVMSLCLTN
jgi:hypothetical protein